MEEITVTARIAVEVHEAEEGGFWGTVPILPGCCSEAETIDQLIINLREAAELYLKPYPPAAARRVKAAARRLAKEAAAHALAPLSTPRKVRKPKRTG